MSNSTRSTRSTWSLKLIGAAGPLTLLMMISLSSEFKAQTKTAKTLGVQTQESQTSLTPAQALRNLTNGNARFVGYPD